MAKLEIEKVARFEAMLHTFARVQRVANVTDREARENDAEHSYFLTMLAWYVVDTFALPLDKDKIRMYALAHDLVEVYATDTYFFDTAARETKHEREEASRLRIEREFPEFTDLHETIQRYEAQADAESKFVKELDKLEPVISNYLQHGRTQKEMGVRFDDALADKRMRITHHQVLRDFLEDIFALMEPNQTDHFAD